MCRKCSRRGLTEHVSSVATTAATVATTAAAIATATATWSEHRSTSLLSGLHSFIWYCNNYSSALDFATNRLAPMANDWRPASFLVTASAQTSWWYNLIWGCPRALDHGNIFKFVKRWTSVKYFGCPSTPSDDDWLIGECSTALERKKKASQIWFWMVFGLVVQGEFAGQQHRIAWWLGSSKVGWHFLKSNIIEKSRKYDCFVTFC